MQAVQEQRRSKQESYHHHEHLDRVAETTCQNTGCSIGIVRVTAAGNVSTSLSGRLWDASTTAKEIFLGAPKQLKTLGKRAGLCLGADENLQLPAKKRRSKQSAGVGGAVHMKQPRQLTHEEVRNAVHFWVLGNMSNSILQLTLQHTYQQDPTMVKRVALDRESLLQLVVSKCRECDHQQAAGAQRCDRQQAAGTGQPEAFSCLVCMQTNVN